MRQRNSYNKVLSITQTDESSFLQKGLALHQAGQLQEARNVYAEILKKNKNQFDLPNNSLETYHKGDNQYA